MSHYTMLMQTKHYSHHMALYVLTNYVQWLSHFQSASPSLTRQLHHLYASYLNHPCYLKQPNNTHLSKNLYKWWDGGKTDRQLAISSHPRSLLATTSFRHVWFTSWHKISSLNLSLVIPCNQKKKKKWQSTLQHKGLKPTFK